MSLAYPSELCEPSRFAHGKFKGFRGHHCYLARVLLRGLKCPSFPQSDFKSEGALRADDDRLNAAVFSRWIWSHRWRWMHVRSLARCGLRSDIARGPKGAHDRTAIWREPRLN